jgi:hypothetical protein
VALLGVNEVGELQRITDKEDRGVVPRHVIITLFGLELHRESARVSFRIGRPFLTTNGRETDKCIGSLSCLRQELSPCVLGYVSGNLKVAMCTGTFGMNHSLWDPLAIKMPKLLQ